MSEFEGFRKQLEQSMIRWKVPGMAISVVKDGKIVLAEGYGYKDAEGRAAATADTQFSIGSATKSFTSALIAMLADEGILDWDTPVRNYLPDFRMFEDYATNRLTLRDMLSHRTGLPVHDSIWPDHTLDRKGLVQRLRYLEPNTSFRNMFQYNNIMVAAAAYIAESLTGKSWEELVRERLLQPLGMNNTSLNYAEMQTFPDYAFPYIEKDGAVSRIPRYWEIGLIAPAGSINSSVNDMAKWLDFHLKNGKAGETQLISEKNMIEMHTPVIAAPVWPWKFKELPHTLYGMTWFVEPYRGFNMLHHGGELEGFTAMMGLLPDEDIGVMIQINKHKPSLFFIFSVLYRIYDRMLGLDRIDWDQRFFEEKEKIFNTEEAEESLVGEWEVSLFEREAIEGTKFTHDPDGYTGVYGHPGYGRIEIFLEGEELYARYKAGTYLLQHYHYDTFKISDIKMDVSSFTMPMTFITDSNGEITSFTMPLEPSLRPLTFHKKAE